MSKATTKFCYVHTYDLVPSTASDKTGRRPGNEANVHTYDLVPSTASDKTGRRPGNTRLMFIQTHLCLSIKGFKIVQIANV